jgi:hypothetical protein
VNLFLSWRIFVSLPLRLCRRKLHEKAGTRRAVIQCSTYLRQVPYYLVILLPGTSVQVITTAIRARIAEPAVFLGFVLPINNLLQAQSCSSPRGAGHLQQLDHFSLAIGVAGLSSHYYEHLMEGVAGRKSLNDGQTRH